MNFAGAAIALSSSGLVSACQKLDVKAAEIWALVFTETDPPYGGYFRDRRPQLLYEQHIFHRLTGGAYDAQHPQISSPHPGNYGASGDHQYERLLSAVALDESAALKSASWGIGQILGENFKLVGYSDVQSLVEACVCSEDKQLDAVVNEILASHAAQALAAHDWKTFARIYNGPAYAQNRYDESLRGWYAQFTSGAQPDLRVRTAQLYLWFMNYDPSTIDGLWGNRTRTAMQDFQRSNGLPLTQELDDATFQRIVSAAQPRTDPATAVAATRLKTTPSASHKKGARRSPGK